MKRFLKHLITDEKGLSLPIILIVLLIGGLLIAPSLNYAGTCLRSVRSEKSIVKGIFAADAGIENAIWYLKSTPLPTSLPLPQNINGLAVTVQNVDKGSYVFYQGQYVYFNKKHDHPEWVIMSSTIAWDAGADAYKYTISLTKSENASGIIRLENVGALLPGNYTYKAGSAASFPSNLSTEVPTHTLTGVGAHMVDWSLPPAGVKEIILEGTRTQIFYILGTGDLADYCCWAAAVRQDVGEVSELRGDFYQITATAKEGTTTIASVTADVMKNASGVFITSWRIN